MLRCCSQCGSNGHNSRTCRFSAAASAVSGGGSGVGGVGGEVMLFGVRLNEDPIRKSVSMSNLSQYEHTNNLQKKNLNSTNDVLEPSKAADEVTAGGGYASADDALPLPPGSARERKRGVPWTEEEHKLFLLGLQKVGKGDWRGISRNFVKTRTPTQVASHAQKYYLRKTNLNRRRRRSSLFDITTDSVPGMPLEEPKSQQDDTAQAIVPVSSAPPTETPRISGLAVAPFPVTVGSYFWPVQVQNPIANMPVCQGNNYTNTSTVFVQPVPVPVLTVPNASATAALDLNQRMVTEPSPLSWRLSLLPDSIQSSTRHSVYKEASFNNGDSFITVA